MPEQFKSKNGATIAGHSAKWSDSKRGQNSHEAGRGSRGSRNQGTGEAGKSNTTTDTVVDTTKMSPEDKLKYFNSLGLLGAQTSTKQPPKAAPHTPPAQDAKSLVSTLQGQWSDVFQSPNHVRQLISDLKSVHPAKFKKAVQAAYRATQEATIDMKDPSDIYDYISSAIEQYTYDGDDF